MKKGESFEFNIGFRIPEDFSPQQAFGICNIAKGLPVYIHKTTKKVAAYIEESVIVENGVLLVVKFSSRHLEEAFFFFNMKTVADRYCYVDIETYFKHGVQ